MKKIIKVSVGISAFNEENNIKNVLLDILSQKQSGWKMTEVLIFNDGSTDETAEKVKGVNHKLVKIYADNRRRGKTFRLSQMFKAFKGDVLIMLDGDIKLFDKNVISNLLKPFSDKDVMLVGGNSKPFPPKGFIQRSVYSTFSVFYNSRRQIKSGNNVFGCTGSILAIRKKLAKEIKLPKVINEDAFIYFYCLKKGQKFIYEDSAMVSYKLPSNLKDYLKQLFRSNPEAVDAELKKYFGGLVESEFNRSFNFYFGSILTVFKKRPLEVLFIVLVNVLSKPFYGIISKNYKLSWFTASSTH